MKAACFTSMLHHARRGETQKSVYIMQVNKALLVLLDLLLEECWDAPETLEVLLCNLPQFDLRSVQLEASEMGYVSLLKNTLGPKAEHMLIICIALCFRRSSLYEQDESNVFSERSVMCAYVLPYLLQMAGKYSESAALAQSLRTWAEQNVAQVLDSLAVCREFLPGNALECVLHID